MYTVLALIPSMVVHVCNSKTWEGVRKDQEFKVILGYRVISGLAWDTRDLVIKNKNKNKKPQRRNTAHIL